MTLEISPLRDASALDDKSSPSSVRTSFRLFSRPRNDKPSSSSLRTRRRRANKQRGTAHHHQRDPTKDPTWEIKIRILQKNPALFQALRDTLNDAPVYSHWAAGPHIVEFLGRLRMTELREDILAYQTTDRSSSSGGGLLGYLQKREKSPPQASMRAVVTRISTSTVLFGADQDFSMPSLGGTEGSDDDDSSSGGGSVMSVRLEF